MLLKMLKIRKIRSKRFTIQQFTVHGCRAPRFRDRRERAHSSKLIVKGLNPSDYELLAVSYELISL